jgi:hypothetical protein
VKLNGTHQVQTPVQKRAHHAREASSGAKQQARTQLVWPVNTVVMGISAPAMAHTRTVQSLEPEAFRSFSVVGDLGGRVHG